VLLNIQKKTSKRHIRSSREDVSKKIKIIVCLDEFQNIEYFNEPLAFQILCSSYWQNHKIATYILFGSKQHMLTKLFQSRSAPFYRFGDIISLQKIYSMYLSNHIIDRFASTKKEILEIFKNSVNFYDPIFELWLKERYFI
jgi:hypothetical protein